MMRRFAAACVAASVSVTLFLSSAAGAYAESSTSAAASAEAADEEAPAASGISIDTGAFLTEEQTAELTKNMNAVAAFLTSEELQGLLKYEEVRDLLKTIFEGALAFTGEEPELFAEIMDALGLDEVYMKVILSGLSVLRKAKDNLDAYLRSEEGQQLQESVRLFLSDPENVSRLEEINQMLEEYVQVTDSEGEGAESSDGGATDNE